MLYCLRNPTSAIYVSLPGEGRLFNMRHDNIVLAFAQSLLFSSFLLSTLPFSLLPDSDGRHHYFWSGCCADKLSKRGSPALLIPFSAHPIPDTVRLASSSSLAYLSLMQKGKNKTDKQKRCNSSWAKMAIKKCLQFIDFILVDSLAHTSWSEKVPTRSSHKFPAAAKYATKSLTFFSTQFRCWLSTFFRCCRLILAFFVNALISICLHRTAARMWVSVFSLLHFGLPC